VAHGTLRTPLINENRTEGSRACRIGRTKGHLASTLPDIRHVSGVAACRPGPGTGRVDTGSRHDGGFRAAGPEARYVEAAADSQPGSGSPNMVSR
jgi:hypothetical protein